MHERARMYERAPMSYLQRLNAPEENSGGYDVARGVCCISTHLSTQSTVTLVVTFHEVSLASQPYFSLFPVGGARGREKYVWTLWPASRGSPH